MSSRKVSQQGLAIIKQAIEKRGWRISDRRWIVEASNLLEPDGSWQVNGPYAYGCSLQTWERFLQRVAIRDRSFDAFCQILDLPPQDVAEPTYSCSIDWGCAPDVPTLYGREPELGKLENWIFEERCRLVSVVGFAGSGKTRLIRGGFTSVELAKRAQSEFECLIWRRLNARSLEALLQDLISFIANPSEGSSDTVEGLMTQFLNSLKQRRCLILLDNAEPLLPDEPKQPANSSFFEERSLVSRRAYAALFKQIGQIEHQSCVLVASREVSEDIEKMEGNYPVRTLQLSGLNASAVQKLFQNIAQRQQATFQGSAEDWEAIATAYGGNPLMLEAVAKRTIKWFDGSLSDFLVQDLQVFGNIRTLLEPYFESLSDAQKEVVMLLSEWTEPVSIKTVRSNLSSPILNRSVLETLDYLERRMLIKVGREGVGLEPVFGKYVRDRLKDDLYESHSLTSA